MQPGDQYAGARDRADPESTAPAVAYVVSMTAAVERDLEEIAKADKKLAESSLAGIARAMAAEIDASTNSATSKAMCAGRLHEAMERLRELVPPKQERTKLDDLAEKRDKRQRRAKTAS